MPLDPGDERWLNTRFGQLETSADHFSIAAQELSLKLHGMEERLRTADARNRALWAVSLTLFFLLLASLNSHLSTSGALDATVKANTRQIQDLQAENKAIANELHEHERRASTPKPEPSR